MKIRLLIVLGGLFWGASAMAQDSLLDYVAEACAADKAKFCSQVTPGDPRRMLACAYAHEDKLSGQCSYALYRAASVMEEIAAALTYLAESCAGEVERFCSDVRMGEGRILACLDENQARLGETCSAAIKETVAE